VTATTTLHAGHDVAYFTRGQGSGGCLGTMSYYSAAGEPPGQWAGKAAARQGLAGQVDPGVIERLSQLDYVMVPRLDGNGAEVGGVSQQVMDLFSSRSGR
jgi:TrwC relaxase